MSRQLLFVLLLATGTALANNKPGAQNDTAAAEAQAKAEKAQGQTKRAQAKMEGVQARTGNAQARAEEAQGQTKKVQVQTEGVPAQTGNAQAKREEAQEQAEKAQVQTEGDAKLASVPGGSALGMSILGNREAPKSLVIVPWKSSEPGASPGFSLVLDDSRQPVDKEVFMRALRYYEIRSEKKP